MESTTCSTCGAPFRGGDSVITVLGRRYHTACFACDFCHQLLANGLPPPHNSTQAPHSTFHNSCGHTGTYMARFGRPLCRACYQRLFGTYCAFCNEPVAGACVEPRPGLCFHPNHFVCHRCGASLTPGFVPRGTEYLCRTCGGQP